VTGFFPVKTFRGSSPIGTVATTMLVAVSITETLLSDFIRDALEGARTHRAL
jgi:hypothetical protein